MRSMNYLLFTFAKIKLKIKTFQHINKHKIEVPTGFLIRRQT